MGRLFIIPTRICWKWIEVRGGNADCEIVIARLMKCLSSGIVMSKKFVLCLNFLLWSLISKALDVW